MHRMQKILRFVAVFSPVMADLRRILNVKLCFSILLLSFLCLPVYSETAVPSHPELREELLAMAEEDQKAREALAGMSVEERGIDQAPTLRMIEVDRANTERLQAIVRTHGWPSISMVGEDGSSAAWMLAQHADADRDFQTTVLELMQKLLPAHEVRASEVAYLYDRITRPQRYGTQGACVGPGKWEPHELENPDEVDKLREEVGIQPTELSEYIAFINQFCK